MSEPKEPLGQLTERIRNLNQGEINVVIAATEKFSPERNQSLLLARTIASKQPKWSERLNEVENTASRRFYELDPQGDTLQRAVFWVAIQGAALATMAKPSLSPSDYRRLVKPVAKVVDWLADEAGVGDAPSAPEDPGQREDETPEVEPASQETEQMAIATKPVQKPKPSAKPSAQKRLAAQNVANTPITPRPEPAGNGDHAQTEFYGKGKKEGVRVKPTRGGFSICVIGENHRVITGHFPSAELAKKAAEKNGLTVKKMPGQRASVEDEKPEPKRAVMVVPDTRPGIERVAEDAKAGTSAAAKDKAANTNGKKAKPAKK